MFIEGLAWCGLFNNMICNMLSYFELSEPTLEARTKSEMTDFLSAKKGLILKLIKSAEICMIIVHDCACASYGTYC